MSFNTSLINDVEKIFKDLTNPATAIEGRTVGTTAVTFTTPLTGGIPYLLFSNGATAYYTLDGTTPTLADGTSAKGMVAPNGLYEPMIVNLGTSGTLKVIVSGSVSSFVTLQRASLSSSIG